MKFWRYTCRKKCLELAVVAITLFSLLSLMHMLTLSRRMVQKTSKIYKQLEKPVNADVNPPASPEVTHLLNKEKTKEEPKLMFQPAVDIVLPSGFKVILRGLKELPDNFRLRSSNEKDTFSFQLQPSRIIGQSGLLTIREFQGNSWAGTLMKGAIVFFIQSSACHYRRRMLQRSTWGSIRDIDGWKIEIVFIVGTSNDSAQNTDLDRENKKYGDMLQYNGSDLAKTSKVLASLYWAIHNLPGDFYYASMTDDILLDIAAVRDHVSSQARHFIPIQDQVYTMIASDGTSVTSSKPQKVYCFEKYLEEEEPLRDPKYWRSVPILGYDAAAWPPYCSEGLYVLPVSLAQELFEESLCLNASLPHELHDVLITGILRRRMKRGDDNISSAITKRPSLRRFEVLSKSCLSERLENFELIAEDDLQSAWKVWYKKIHSRFHIKTSMTSR